MKFFGLSWSLVHWRGVDIRFHFSMLFSIPIAYYLFKPVDLRGAVEALMWVVGLTLFILLHEIGHAVTAQAVGVEVKSVVVWLLGGLTNLAYKPEKPAHNFFIYAAGPLMNMLLAFLCVMLYIIMAVLFLPLSENPQTYIWLQTFQEIFFSLAIVNLILVVFNLIPVYPLDGGNILHATMEWLFGRVNADRITLAVGLPLLGALVVLAIAMRDYILLGFCVLIAISISSLNHGMLKNVNLAITYLFKRAGYYYLRGDFERAAQLYTADIEKSPEDVNNYLARAGCYLSIGQRERALADVERALRLDPGQLFALELRGEIHMLDKKYDTALEIFDQTQAMNPNWAVPYFDHASLMMERGELQPALAGFNKAIALQARMPLFYIIRSLAHYKLGDLKAAHEDQDVAVGISPEEALVMVDVNLMIYEDNLHWAQDFYGRVLDKNPRNPLALQGLAEACLVNREFSSAATFFSRALDVNSREARLYLGRGKAYLGMSEKENARTDLEKVQSSTDKLHLKRQAEDLLKTLN
ncbi:MAG: site-2 protease family protein [Anaerolineales bacterium]|uniref:site-2 protease family protein n=1 Tax=Candidatus Villigracilis vicinus TaxID=3140679 RepID=UPI00313579C3|nr:site-2 protease family protein [Anaerolineales bacterium]MBK9780957.1 site-2 protease family protein [Anaerolineales bacterium]